MLNDTGTHMRRYTIGGRPSWLVRLQRFGWIWFILAVSVAFTPSCRNPQGTESRNSVQVEVKGVSFDPVANSPVIILQNKEQTKAIPIWVGLPEAQSIHLQLQGTVLPRPMTHDLLKNILEKVGVGFEKVVVTEMKGGTYYAFIHLANGKTPLQIDSRPSDAIALALRFHRPIFVATHLFDEAIPGGEAHPVTLAPISW
ncbi:MAG: bifunctional nuclease family protein [Deltaproteobacteria bacterium]|nr:bifunctional nuclease family protein [Deltaproteobacteria bacterium]